MIETANLGFPRIGLHRELKFALERFWSGEWTAEQLETAAREIRPSNWQTRPALQNVVTAARRVRGSLALQTWHRRQSEEAGA